MLIWLQLSGGTFPTGSFNHSYGLETYIQANRVTDAADVERILVTYLEVYLHTDVIFVKEAYEAALKKEFDRLQRLQDLYSASKPARELYLASMKTGRALLLGVKNLYEEAPERFGKWNDPTLAYHYALAYGMVSAMMGMPLVETMQTYLYAGLASLVAAATRIMPLGQNESQLVLFRLSRRITELQVNYEELSLEDVHTFSPGLEIASMEHETLYTRLCMS